ncbi:hypothetical protein [Rhizobium sp. LjRoot258]|uniref:hypothetical protein n=1 Tax=Rhizobium sp. LjRoot258 TaxID=3342299 RepID=UPI003ECCE8E4
MKPRRAPVRRFLEPPTVSDQANNRALPYMLPSQARKHVTHNEALQRLDAIVQLYRRRTLPSAVRRL